MPESERISSTQILHPGGIRLLDSRAVLEIGHFRLLWQFRAKQKRLQANRQLFDHPLSFLPGVTAAPSVTSIRGKVRGDFL